MTNMTTILKGVKVNRCWPCDLNIIVHHEVLTILCFEFLVYLRRRKVTCSFDLVAFSLTHLCVYEFQHSIAINILLQAELLKGRKCLFDFVFSTLASNRGLHWGLFRFETSKWSDWPSRDNNFDLANEIQELMACSLQFIRHWTTLSRL